MKIIRNEVTEKIHEKEIIGTIYTRSTVEVYLQIFRNNGNQNPNSYTDISEKYEMK